MTTFAINEQLSLNLPPGTAMARIARQSRNEALRALAQAVAEAQEATSPLADWIERFLNLSDPEAATEHDELFVSYRQFCDAVRVPREERLAYQAFGRALTVAGLKLEQVAGGAPVRRGCKLRKRVPLQTLLEEEGSVDEFLAERCRIAPLGSKERIRSLALYEAYRAWSSESDRDAIGLKRFTRQMELLGLRRQRSDGIWWPRVELIQAVPRPLQDDSGASTADRGGE